MNNKDLVKSLRKMQVETGSLVCFGCGHEHNCGIHGCAIIREASDVIEGRHRLNRRRFRFRNFMYRKFPGMKLLAICKAIGIQPYGWQIEYALTGQVERPFPCGRATGKTTACMLRILTECPHDATGVMEAISCDPDFSASNRRRIACYDHEYLRLMHICEDAGIDVIHSAWIFSTAVMKTEGRHRDW